MNTGRLPSHVGNHEMVVVTQHAIAVNLAAGPGGGDGQAELKDLVDFAARPQEKVATETAPTEEVGNSGNDVSRCGHRPNLREAGTRDRRNLAD